MSSPVDVPGRGPAHDLSAISTSPTFSFLESHLSPTSSLLNMPNALARPECPLPLLPGELLEEPVEFMHCKGYLTNYRFIILSYTPRNQTPTVEVIAIGNIDQVDSHPNDQLLILCKDARIIRLHASTTEQAITWYKKLTAMSLPRSAPSIFALAIARKLETRMEWIKKQTAPEFTFDEKAVFTKWGMDPDYFTVVDYNADYSICPSYPRNLIVPKTMDRKEIESLRDYRMLGRIPAVVWHCPNKNVLLLRASQPRSAFLNWRNDKDEKFLRLVVEYTSKKRGVENSGKIKIFDCRSYMATLGNRIKGGGSEREDNYTNMKLEYCNLPNIHGVRYTFTALRNLFNPPVEQTNFLSTLQNTQWLSNLVSILSYSNKAAEQLDKGRNVLIHCSDGWDRTTQLVTLAKILVDPHYRTIAGLEELIRRDWIGYGHKFSDRNGISGTDSNERCPVFLQWLDALHQIHSKHPTLFEYSMAYLVKLAVHTSSGLFTSFNFNTVQEMETVLENEKSPPFPIWRMLNSDIKYENALYDRKLQRERLIAPENMQAMRLWNEVYRCQDVASLLPQSADETGISPASSATSESRTEEEPETGDAYVAYHELRARYANEHIEEKKVKKCVCGVLVCESTVAAPNPTLEDQPSMLGGALTSFTSTCTIVLSSVVPNSVSSTFTSFFSVSTTTQEDADAAVEASEETKMHDESFDMCDSPEKEKKKEDTVDGEEAKKDTVESQEDKEDNEDTVEGTEDTVEDEDKAEERQEEETVDDEEDAKEEQDWSFCADHAPDKKDTVVVSPTPPKKPEEEETEEEPTSGENKENEDPPVEERRDEDEEGDGILDEDTVANRTLETVLEEEEDTVDDWSEDEKEESTQIAQTPVRRIRSRSACGGADRSDNGMDRSMVKSKSTESIASTSESQIFNSPTNGASQLPPRSESDDEERDARERRNTRTNSTTAEERERERSKESNNGGTTTATATASTTASSTPSGVMQQDMRTILDHDGLAKFIDLAQESARKKFAEFEETAMRKEETERQRMRSEMSDASINERPRGDEEQFYMDDIMSDASYVDDNELDYTPKHVGTQVNATHCSICRDQFNMINSKLNCHSCGRAVCHRCSSHSYMETEDGAARIRKACTECYSKMYSTPTPLHPASSSSTPLHPPPTSSSSSSSGGTERRGCPDGDSNGQNTPYVSPSQAVKG